jgi:hypothetical protein
MSKLELWINVKQTLINFAYDILAELATLLAKDIAEIIRTLIN